MTKAIYRLDIGPYSYIGSAKNLKQRVNKHERELLSKKHSNVHMQNVFNKYNHFNFVILETLSEDEDQFEIEQTYLDCLDFKDQHTLNKSFVARGMNSEMAKALTIKNIEIWKTNLLSLETIRKRSQTARSECSRKKMSDAIKTKLETNSTYKEKVRISRVMGGRISSLMKYGYKNLLPPEAEHRTSLSETFVEYYKNFGLIKPKKNK